MKTNRKYLPKHEVIPTLVDLLDKIIRDQPRKSLESPVKRSKPLRKDLPEKGVRS